jgi:hypothetical protein
MVVSVGSAPRLYNEDPRPAEGIIEGVSRDGIELVELQECGCERKTSCVL